MLVLERKNKVELVTKIQIRDGDIYLNESKTAFIKGNEIHTFQYISNCYDFCIEEVFNDLSEHLYNRHVMFTKDYKKRLKGEEY